MGKRNSYSLHLFFCVMIFLVKSMAFAEQKCDVTEYFSAFDEAEKYRGAIERRFKSEDVEPLVSALKLVLRKCNISKPFGSGSGFSNRFPFLKEKDYQFWLKTGWLAEAEKWKKKAIYTSNFRNPQSDRKNYIKFAEKGGLHPREILHISNILYKDTNRKGSLSEKRERKIVLQWISALSWGLFDIRVIWAGVMLLMRLIYYLINIKKISQFLLSVWPSLIIKRLERVLEISLERVLEISYVRMRWRDWC